jgi:hypothetical protein
VSTINNNEEERKKRFVLKKKLKNDVREEIMLERGEAPRRTNDWTFLTAGVRKKTRFSYCFETVSDEMESVESKVRKWRIFFIFKSIESMIHGTTGRTKNQR